MGPLFFLDILGIVGLIVCIVLCSILIGGVDFNSENVEEFRDNFYDTPIFDLTITTGQCPAGKTSIDFDDWAGTVRGCECVGSSFTLFPTKGRHYVDRGNCYKRYEDDACHWIKGFDPSPINLWKGAKFCAKKMNENYSYYSLLQYSVKKGQQCPKGYKSCGYLDTLDNILCLTEKDECPVNFMEVVAKGNPQPEECKKYGCDSFTQSDESVLYYSNKVEGGHVIGGFKISDEKVCLDFDEYNSQNEPYTLDYHEYYGCKTEYNGIKYDERYELLDQNKKSSTYEENGILEKVESLADYPLADLRQSKLGLYVRTFFGFEPSCLVESAINPENVDDYKSHSKTSRNLIIASLVFVCINTVYLLVTMWVKDEGACLAWGNVFMFLLTFILSVSAFAMSKKLKLLGNNCGDKYSEALMTEIQSDINTNNSYSAAVFALSLISVVVYIIEGLFSLGK